MDSTYKHIVLFKIHDDVSEENFTKALTMLQNLGQNNPDILEWTVTPSLDTRKGRIIIEDSTFTSQEAFEAFRTSDKHAETAVLMREIADWLVGDYLSAPV